MKSDKSVLVINTPKDCIDCPLFAFECCHVRRKEIPMENITQGTKPEWCALKPLPEKGTMDNVESCAYNEGFIDGRNHCIELIAGDYITQEEADLCGVQLWHDD